MDILASCGDCRLLEDHIGTWSNVLVNVLFFTEAFRGSSQGCV